ncbi:MAG: hypothetical protein ACLQU4_00945 [Limisphaerales bacterium]
MFWFAALAGVLLILLHESLFLGKGLVPVDALLELPPWSQPIHPSNGLLADQYWTFVPTQEFVHQQKSLPLWNPYICCGVPNLGSMQGALLFPIQLLLSPLDPFYASGPAAFLKLCLAGWFTMLYVRLLGVSRPAAFMAGLVFSLSGFMIVWLGHPHVNCAMWLPLLLYFLEKSFRQGQGNAIAVPALRAWCGFAVAFAFMILGGASADGDTHYDCPCVLLPIPPDAVSRWTGVATSRLAGWRSRRRVAAGGAADPSISGVLRPKLKRCAFGPTVVPPRVFLAPAFPSTQCLGQPCFGIRRFAETLGMARAE